MKKSSWIVWILALMCVCVLSACNDSISPQTPSDTLSETTDDTKSENNPHIHYFSEWTTVEYATCTVNGEQERSCVCGEKETNIIDAIGHTEVTDAAVAATCTADGKTEGKHCSVCNETLVAQTVVGKFDHKFGDWSITKYATNSQEGERVHICSLCNTSEYDVIDIIRYDGSLGSAGKISDTTIIVSIFANDSETSWNFSSDEDCETINTMYEHLSSAVDWLEKECAKYGAETKLIFDWTRHADLFYTFDFSDMNMVRADGGGYKTQRAYIKNHIDSEKIKQKYNAQNILYILYFNVDETNTINSWTLSDRKKCDVEVINIFVRDISGNKSYMQSAATFAHEILHCFGAYDLYYASKTIPQAYVDYCKQSNSKDIMYTVNLGKEIRMKFTELCAYYVGLIDTCETVEIWGLGKSTHT